MQYPVTVQLNQNERVMKVLVTGATGHLGWNLTKELLNQNYDVKVLCRENSDLAPLKNLDVEIAYGNVMNPDSIKASLSEVSTVFHLASQISLLPFEKRKVFSVNVSGTNNVMDQCIKNGKTKLIYMSSIHAITDENDHYHKSYIGTYAKSKGIATKKILQEINKGNLDGIVLYPTGLIGPNDYKISNIGHTIINHATKGTVAYIDGAYDFVDVRDVATATIASNKKSLKDNEYILSSENPITVLDLLQELEILTGNPAPKLKIPKSIALYYGHLNGLLYKSLGKKTIVTGYSIKTLQTPIPKINSNSKKDLYFNNRNWKHSLKDQYDWLKYNSHIPM